MRWTLLSDIQALLPGKTFSRAFISAAQQSVIQLRGFQSGFHCLTTAIASEIASKDSSDIMKDATTWYTVFVLTTMKKIGRAYFEVLYVASNKQSLLPYCFSSLCWSLVWCTSNILSPSRTFLNFQLCEGESRLRISSKLSWSSGFDL